MSDEHSIASIATIIIFVLLVVYVIGGSYSEKKKFVVGHETGLAILIGFLISLIIMVSGKKEINKSFMFDDRVFFYFCLPPIIFSSGYNMRRKKFFANFGYILIFGLIGTIITFVVFTLITYAFMEAGVMWKYNVNSEGPVEFKLSIMETILVSTLLCSSDVIAAISIVKYEEQPKLYSLLFGEGMVNDAVAIILFNTVSGFQSGGEVFTKITPLRIIGDFLKLGVLSTLIGVLCGLVASYIFKKCRFVTVSAIKETLLIFCFGYISYGIAELLHMSGIISLLTSGIIMAHYAWYSLSPQGKHVSSVAFQVLGFGAEAFVFSYLGLACFSYYDYDWSWQFILVEILVVIVGRFLGTIGLIYFLVLLRHKKRVTFKELCFISYSGLIRGAIAFGLVLQIDHSVKEREVIITTSLALVLFTTVVFGSLMPLVQRCLLVSKKNGSKDSMLNDVNEEGDDTKRNEQRNMSLSEHEEFLHPNMMGSEDDQSQIAISVMAKDEKKKKDRGTCARYFKRFDEFIMRPIFIYNYQHDLNKRKDEFQDLFEKEGDKWEQIYLQDKQNSGQSRPQSHTIMQHISATSFARSNTKRQTTKPLTNNTLDFKKTLSQGNIFTPHIIRQTTHQQNHLVRLQNSKNPRNSVQTSISSPSFSMVDKGFNQMQLVHEDNEEQKRQGLVK